MYALGVTIYQLIHGFNPYKGNNKMEYWNSTMNDEIWFADSCPKQWRVCILKLMSTDAKRRPTARQMLGIGGVI